MPKCPQCKSENLVGAARCAVCASPLGPVVDDPNPKMDATVQMASPGKNYASSGHSSPIYQNTGPVHFNVGTGALMAIMVTVAIAASIYLIERSPKADLSKSNRSVDLGDERGFKEPEPKPVPKAIPVPDAPPGLRVVLDRELPVYLEGEKLSVGVQVPTTGFLYVASVWAEDEGVYLIYHPGWQSGLVNKGYKNGNAVLSMDFNQYKRLNTVPLALAKGCWLELNDMTLEYLAPNLNEASAQVIAILSEQPLEKISADSYRKDIRPALESLGLLKKRDVGEAGRNLLPPDLIQLQKVTQVLSASVRYTIQKQYGK